MARLYLRDFEWFCTDGHHTATSWQVAKDENFELLIDQSLDDKVNLTEWNTRLPKRAEDIALGEEYPFYGDETELYARAKVHMGKTESNWFPIGPKSQTVQKVIITQEDQPDVWSDTQELGWDPSSVDDPDILTPKVPEGDTV